MKPREYLILTALAGEHLHGLAIARAVEELSEGRTRLWPVSLYGTLDDLVSGPQRAAMQRVLLDGRIS